IHGIDNMQATHSDIDQAGLKADVPGIHRVKASPNHKSAATLVRNLTRTPQFRKFCSRAFRVFQRMGVNITPAHFYWPIPNLKSLEEKKDWARCSLSDGVQLDLSSQIRRLESDFLQFAGEWNFAPQQGQPEHEFHLNNGYFEAVDAEIAYSMIRHLRPRKIMEI